MPPIPEKLPTVSFSLYAVKVPTSTVTFSRDKTSRRQTEETSVRFSELCVRPAAVNVEFTTRCVKRRASILADLELECRGRGHGGACCYPHRRRERRRESEHHIGRVRGGRVRLNREVRPVLPDLRCASCERTRHVGGSHIRDREGAVQEAGRVRVDRDDRDWNASGED